MVLRQMFVKSFSFFCLTKSRHLFSTTRQWMMNLITWKCQWKVSMHQRVHEIIKALCPWLGKTSNIKHTRFYTKLPIQWYGYNHAISIVALTLCVDSNHMAKIYFYSMVLMLFHRKRKENESECKQDQKVQIMERRMKQSIWYTENMYEIISIISVYIM